MKAESASGQGMGPSGGHGVLGCLGRDRRAAVALLVAVLLPVMLGAVALALEVGSWAVTRIQLQRRADIAAMTAASQFILGSTAQVAAGNGTDLAKLNGATATGRSWSGASSTLTSSDVTLAKVSGVISASDTAWQATVTQAMPLSFGRLLTTNTSVTVSASAIAEIVTGSGSGGQPCLLALSTTGTGVSISGGITLNTTNCNVRSNSDVTVTGGSTVNTAWVYAGGSATVNGGSTVTNGSSSVNQTNYSSWTNTAPIYNSAGTISDPYASDTDITNAFSCLSSDSCGVTSRGAYSGGYQGGTLSPGYYTSITTGGGGTFTMSAGTYYVQGNVSISNGSSLTSSGGVTLVVGGTVSFAGGSAVTLTAPTANATSGIPGLLIASNSTASSSLSNGMKPTLTGAIYYPNGAISISGGVQVANGCLQLIANTITFTGGTSLDTTNCNSIYGTPNYYSMPGIRIANLVQ